MALGYEGSLYILAFDHRGSFQKKMFGIEGDPTERVYTCADTGSAVHGLHRVALAHLLAGEKRKRIMPVLVGHARAIRRHRRFQLPCRLIPRPAVAVPPQDRFSV